MNGGKDNNKNGLKLIGAITGTLTTLAVLFGLFHTVFIRPLEKRIDEKTEDRWTREEEMDSREAHNREHDKLDGRIEKCCSK